LLWSCAFVLDGGALRASGGAWGLPQLDGELPVRVHAYVPLATWPKLAALVATEGRGGGHLTWGGVKAFMDGSLGSRTALLHSPYEDDTTTSGLRVEELQDVLRHVHDADAAGLQARTVPSVTPPHPPLPLTRSFP